MGPYPSHPTGPHRCRYLLDAIGAINGTMDAASTADDTLSLQVRFVVRDAPHAPCKPPVCARCCSCGNLCTHSCRVRLSHATSSPLFYNGHAAPLN
jgi:hypothetical protein